MRLLWSRWRFFCPGAESHDAPGLEGAEGDYELDGIRVYRFNGTDAPDPDSWREISPNELFLITVYIPHGKRSMHCRYCLSVDSIDETIQSDNFHLEKRKKSSFDPKYLPFLKIEEYVRVCRNRYYSICNLSVEGSFYL